MVLFGRLACTRISVWFFSIARNIDKISKGEVTACGSTSSVFSDNGLAVFMMRNSKYVNQLLRDDIEDGGARLSRQLGQLGKYLFARLRVCCRKEVPESDEQGGNQRPDYKTVKSERG